MNLKYNILWLDDSIDDFKEMGIIHRVEEYIKKTFFIPKIDACDEIEEALDNVNKNKYDLIISDYNIEEGKTGDNFIREVRKKHINTEILFYSGQQQYLEARKNLDEERISYVSTRAATGNGNDILVLKIKDLFDLTIERFQELTVIRGLVMSETSALDQLMTDIIIRYFVEKDIESHRSLFDTVKKYMENSIKGNIRRENCDNNCSLKLNNKSIKEIVTSRAFDASKKAYAVCKIIKQEKLGYQFNKSFYEEYLNNIINLRNQLAHTKSKVEEGVEVLIIDDDNTKRIDKSDFDDIRKNIIRYNTILHEIYNRIE